MDAIGKEKASFFFTAEKRIWIKVKSLSSVASPI
jgi:hypothetical protein